MRRRTGEIYRVTYRRIGWNAGRESSKLFFTQRAAERFAERLERTEGVAPPEYADITWMSGPWIAVDGRELHDPGTRPRGRKFVERTVGDWSDEDDGHEAQD